MTIKGKRLMKTALSKKTLMYCTLLREEDWQMKIREYSSEDYEQVVSLWLECKLIERKSSATHEQLSAFSSRNRGLFLVCESNAKVIGSVMGAWDGWRGWIYKLAVSEAFRRSGVGAKLVCEVTQRLRQAGAGIVRAYVEKQNNASLALFAGRGFERMDDFVLVTLGRQ